MLELLPAPVIGPLRQRLIEEMSPRDVGRLSAFLGRELVTATAEDPRRFQVERGRAGGTATPCSLGDLLALLRLWWRASRQQGVMPDDGWLFPGQHDAAREANDGGCDRPLDPTRLSPS